ncbi:hypothetical protein KIH27_02035 [Mycobacterium sp. M1]|uniref:Uncharacterized protein n=1 Tax=Mycolicibacter acidiphilus TaxID=2835306 RepID=A0ABS5RDV2_9MYCO|nr:hypothetical protein [Mycolicibacter acidiphilus]MBS9532364.1 hypothetical protein [Mycolicibacter acidiphilus]
MIRRRGWGAGVADPGCVISRRWIEAAGLSGASDERGPVAVGSHVRWENDRHRGGVRTLFGGMESAGDARIRVFAGTQAQDEAGGDDGSRDNRNRIQQWNFH